MLLIICVFYFYLFEATVQKENKLEPFDQENFSKSIDSLVCNIHYLFEKHVKELKAQTKNIFKNIKNYRSLYYDFKKENTLVEEENNFIKHFSSIKYFDLLEEAQKHVEEFVETFNKSENQFKKEKAYLKNSCKDEYVQLYHCLKKHIINLLAKKKIKKKNYEEVIDQANFMVVGLIIQIYDFERRVLSYETKLDAYKVINPIHELITYSKEKKLQITYVDIVIDKLDTYDLHEELKNFLYDLKAKNHYYINFFRYLKKMKIRFNKFEIANKNPTSEEIEGFLNPYFLENKTLQGSNKNLTDNCPQILQNEIKIIKKIFSDLLIEHEKLKTEFYKSLKEAITYFFEPFTQADSKEKNNWKSFKKNFFKFIKGDYDKKTEKIHEKIKIILNQKFIDYILSVKSINKAYQLNLRKTLNNLIQKIEHLATNKNLNETEKIKVNGSKIRDYNNWLKNGFLSFAKDLVATNEKFMNYYNDFIKSKPINPENIENTDFLSYIVKTNHPIFFKRKIEIISRFHTLFTKNEIKKECLCGFLESITNADIKLNLILEDLKVKNSSKVKDGIMKYLTAEKEFLTQISNWTFDQIKLIHPSYEKKTIPVTKKLPSLKNEEKKPIVKKSKKMVVVAFILIPIIIGTGIFLIYKFKIKV